MSSTASAVRNALLQDKVVAVLRGDFDGQWLAIADALLAGGIRAIEVTLTCHGAFEALAALVNTYSSHALIGAGTVLTAEEVDRCVALGAQYVVAPNTNVDVIQRCQAHHVLSIPGAFTPTEIEYAHRMGAGIVKVFPSMPIGPDYLRNIRGPYPDIPIICTGGITLEVAKAFLQAGADAVGLAAPLVHPDIEAYGGLAGITDRAKRLIQAIR